MSALKHGFVSTFALTIAASAIVAAQSVTPLSEKELSNELVVIKSYTIGTEASAFVGNPIVKVKSFRRIEYAVPYMRAKTATVFYKGASELPAGHELKILGTYPTKKHGVCFVLDSGLFSRGNAMKPLVDKNGRYIQSVLQGLQQTWTLRKKRYDLTFERVEHIREEVVPESPNFEILYMGRTESELRLTYREYTRNDLAKPAFFQELVYPADAIEIRFRSLRIKIVEARADGVSFVVIEDGGKD